MEAGDDRQALIYLEESRQLAGSEAVEPQEVSVLLHRPVEPVVVVYGLVGDELLWWRLLDGFLTSGRVTASTVGSVIAPLVAADRRQYQAVDLERAFDLLLTEPLRGVPADRRLALILDGPLYRVPFAALRHPTTDVHLIEERAITVHPTLADALRSGAQQPGQDRRFWRTVVVGDPAFDLESFPSIPRLAGAEREARKLAAIYGDKAILLTAAEASASTIRKALIGVQVFHLAGHALQGIVGSSGAFVLAMEAGNSSTGLGSPDDLFPDAHGLQLVVLSACSSLGSSSTRAAGALGPARPYLRRGVAAVVATLWPIEDTSLTNLMVELHRGIVDGLAASEALRRAQLRASREDEGEALGDWAAVQLVGELPPTMNP